MKDYYEKVADKLLPKFNEKCHKSECGHPICQCGHCARNYHVAGIDRCTRMNPDLTVCHCKQFNPIQMKNTMPKMQCPRCGHEKEDFDGLGMLHCIKCGWCEHAAVTGDRCDYCETIIPITSN